MSEIIIKYKGSKALKAIHDLEKNFDIEIREPVKVKRKEEEEKKIHSSLPITFAKNPNANALSGIWEGQNITVEELREKAWRNRL